MLKLLFLTHRYAGIALGILMVIWCLSGFIMMYKSYPELSETESLSLLPPLTLDNCCAIPDSTSLSETTYQEFDLQMLGSIPVLHLRTVDDMLLTMDLRHSRVFHSVREMFAQNLAAGFASSRHYPEATLLGTIHNDQWTVYGAYNPHRPLYHFAANDDAGTQWYQSSRTGEIIQHTTREQRVWGYLGAVLHWLYPTILREKVQLWSQVVIWLTVIGIFLTATGLYFGLRQFKTRKSGRKSPYRGLSLWHHYAGLLFGLVTFTWVLSGLFSMQPGALMEGEGAQSEAQLLRGGDITWATISALLPRLAALPMTENTVRIEGRVLQGHLALYRVENDATRMRFDAGYLQAKPLPQKELLSLAMLLSPKGRPVATDMITAGDGYYYDHHELVRLPAYRVIANDGKNTRYYLDPVSGEILDKIDTNDKWYRWLHYGLHRGDFTGFLRSRPVWDIFMWILMLGTTAVCITGTCMGFRRLGRSFS